MNNASALRIVSFWNLSRFRKIRLSTNIAITASSLALVMVITIGSVSYFILRNHVAETIRTSLRFDAAMLAGHINGDLTAISTTLLSLSKNSVLTNALMDSMTRYIYLDPFLQDFCQLNGIPIEITLTDYQGQPIAGSPALSLDNQPWGKEVLKEGKIKARIVEEGEDRAIVVAIPIFYFRTTSPEGTLVYKVKISDLLENATQVENRQQHDTDKTRSIQFSATEKHHNTQHRPNLENDEINIVEYFPIFGGNSLKELELGVKVGADRELLEAPLRELFFAFGLIGSVTIIVVLFLGRVAGMHLSEPLAELERVASNVVASGSVNHRFDDEGPQEIARLGKTFNEMLRRLSEAHQNLERAAKFDDLTGLANRKLLRECLHTSLAQADRNKRIVALLLLDLDNFKEINDILGHPAGDALLRQAAERLSGLVRETDTVARLGGDEFAIVATNVIYAQHVEVLARKIKTSFEQPFCLENKKLFAHSSIGIALFPQDSAYVDGLFKNADLALYHVKAHGRNGFHFYDEELNDKLLARRAMETFISRSLAGNGLSLFYQPKFNIFNGSLIGCEALLRCRESGAIRINTQEVIAAAEESGLITKIGEWVLSEACRQARDWVNAGLPAIPIAVNLSAVQLRQYGLVEDVMDRLQKHNIQARCIELEITESAVMEKVDKVTETLSRLHQLGFRLAIDDFGTGYSSMTYLKKFPVDTLKIDASFVDGVHLGGDDAEITRAIIALGQSLGLCVIAEGVENREQLMCLRAYGCQYAQGYFFSPPISGKDFIDWWWTYKNTTSKTAPLSI